MIIGNRQKAELDNKAYSNFIMRMVTHVRQTFCDTVNESDEELLGVIRSWAEQAAKYSIGTEADMEGYIGLCYCCETMRAEPKPWVIRNVLYHHELEPWEKIDYLYDRIIIKNDPEFTGAGVQRSTRDDEVITIV